MPAAYTFEELQDALCKIREISHSAYDNITETIANCKCKLNTLVEQ